MDLGGYNRVMKAPKPVYYTGGIIWEVEGRGNGSKGVAHHTDSPTQVEDLGSTWVGESV